MVPLYPSRTLSIIGKAACLKMFYWRHVGSNTISKLKFLYFYPTYFELFTMISPRSGITFTMDSFAFAISFEERGLHLTATLTHYLSDILNFFLCKSKLFYFWIKLNFPYELKKRKFILSFFEYLSLTQCL